MSANSQIIARTLLVIALSIFGTAVSAAAPPCDQLCDTLVWPITRSKGLDGLDRNRVPSICDGGVGLGMTDTLAYCCGAGGRGCERSEFTQIERECMSNCNKPQKDASEAERANLLQSCIDKCGSK